MMNDTTRRHSTAPIEVKAGDRYGEYTVLCEAPRGYKPSGKPFRVLTVQCSCGTVKDVRLCLLRDGTTISCGHVQKEIARQLGKSMKTHGQSKTQFFYVWKAMLQRCHNPNNKSYPRYGGRGVAVCEEWRNSFEAFAAYMGDRPPGMTVDRINSDGNYEPGNVRWATYTQQARNTRRNHLITVNGVTRCLAEWVEITGVSLSEVKARIKRGSAPFPNMEAAQ